MSQKESKSAYRATITKCVVAQSCNVLKSVCFLGPFQGTLAQAGRIHKIEEATFFPFLHNCITQLCSFADFTLLTPVRKGREIDARTKRRD